MVLVRDSGSLSSQRGRLSNALDDGEMPPFVGPARNGSGVGVGALASSKRCRRERGAVTGVVAVGVGVGNSEEGPFSPGRNVCRWFWVAGSLVSGRGSRLVSRRTHIKVPRVVLIPVESKFGYRALGTVHAHDEARPLVAALAPDVHSAEEFP